MFALAGDVCSVALFGRGAGFGDDEAGAVVDGCSALAWYNGGCAFLGWLTDSASEHVAFLEGVFEFFHADAFFVHYVHGGAAGEEA